MGDLRAVNFLFEIAAPIVFILNRTGAQYLVEAVVGVIGRDSIHGLAEAIASQVIGEGTLRNDGCPVLAGLALQAIQVVVDSSSDDYQNFQGLGIESETVTNPDIMFILVVSS